jgi:hypothetical protein
VRGRQSFRGISGGIDKIFAKISSGTSMYMQPADACIRATLRSVFDRILRALDAGPGWPIILGHILGLMNEAVQVEIT